MNEGTNKEGIRSDVAEALDTIDAAIFSGDNFHSKKARGKLRAWLARFERGLTEKEGVDETDTN